MDRIDDAALTLIAIGVAGAAGIVAVASTMLGYDALDSDSNATLNEVLASWGIVHRKAPNPYGGIGCHNYWDADGSLIGCRRAHETWRWLRESLSGVA